MAEKKRKKRKHFSKLMQKKLVGSFALVLFVLLGLNLRIVYITAKNGDPIQTRRDPGSQWKCVCKK